MTRPLRQTGALLLDAYRELNARKLFWVTLFISGAVVAAFAAVGLNQTGVTFLWWDFPSPYLNARVLKPELVYKWAFANIAIPFWLAWGATILALVSTAGIIPEFVAGGSIELTLSKPIGRWRLFFTKYATGLLFTALQVTVFTAAAFIVIGIRGQSWEPLLFWAIPIMVGFYSYLYCVCALLGLVTRSTIAALLLTIVFWLAVFGVNTTESIFLTFREVNALRIERLEAEIESLRARQARQQEAAAAPDPDGSRPVSEAQAAGAKFAMDKTTSDLAARQQSLEEARRSLETVRTGHRISMMVKTVLPKTSETVKLLDRFLISEEDLDRLKPPDDEVDGRGIPGGVPISQKALQKRLVEAVRSRTIGWVVGTSLAFELFVLGIAGAIFARKDY